LIKVGLGFRVGAIAAAWSSSFFSAPWSTSHLASGRRKGAGHCRQLQGRWWCWFCSLVRHLDACYSTQRKPAHRPQPRRRSNVRRPGPLSLSLACGSGQWVGVWGVGLQGFWGSRDREAERVERERGVSGSFLRNLPLPIFLCFLFSFLFLFFCKISNARYYTLT